MTDVLTDDALRQFAPPKWLDASIQPVQGGRRFNRKRTTDVGGLFVTTRITLDRQASANDIRGSQHTTVLQQKRGGHSPDWKKAILEVLNGVRLASQDLSAHPQHSTDPITLEYAKAFIGGLPALVRPPSVSPDGEGDLLFWWTGKDEVVVIVEQSRLHAILRPGTPHSKHIEDLDFSTRVVPGEIIQILPRS